MSESLLSKKDNPSMNPANTSVKQQLRNEAKAKRLLLDIPGISANIQRHVEAWPEFLQAGTVLVFMPLKGEVDLTPLIGRHPHKQWYLPRTASNGALLFYLYKPGDPLEPNPFGVLEPLTIAPALNTDITPVDLVFIPALMVDRWGTRLGFGKGYYDRFLENPLLQGKTISPIPDALFVGQAIPGDPWDVPVNWVVTEAGVFKTAS